MSQRYVCMAKISDMNLARVAAARLESEGIGVRLHGEAFGPFPLTVGLLAETQLWVVADQAEAAVRALEGTGIICSPQDI